MYRVILIYLDGSMGEYGPVCLEEAAREASVHWKWDFRDIYIRMEGK